MAVEFDSAIILGVDEQCKIGLFGPERTRGSVPQKKTAEALTADPEVNGEAADPHGGERWVAGETSSQLARELANGDAARCEGVVAGNDIVGSDGDETVRHMPSNILSDLLMKIAVEFRHAAGEGATVVGRQRLEAAAAGHVSFLAMCR